MSAFEPRTRPTLLRRVASSTDAAAWEEFYALYAPVLYRYARARGLGEHDAEEVRDHCLSLLAMKLREFRYDRERGRFRGFLRRLARDRVVDILRRAHRTESGELALDDLADPGPSPDRVWERHWREQALLFHLEVVLRAASARDERVLRMLLFDGASPAQVARELDLQVANVHQIKSRLLRRIRQRLAER